MTNELVLASETPLPIVPDISELILGIVAFLILLFILKKYVVPRFEAAYEERAQKIEGGIEKAEKAQAQAEEALAKYQAQLKEARTEAAKIRDDARLEAEQIKAELREQAESESKSCSRGDDESKLRRGQHERRIHLQASTMLLRK